MADVHERERGKDWLRSFEVLCSMGAVTLVLLFPVHAGAAYFCLGGDRSCPSSENVRDYRLMLGLFAAAVLATLVLARARGAGWPTFPWHVVVAIVGTLSAVVFSVPQVYWADRLREDPPAHSPNPYPCHSGSGSCGGGG